MTNTAKNDPANTHVGYIGMGIMGSAMAMNLLQAGFKLTVWNRTASKCNPLKQAGANVASSPADMAQKKPDIICINVTNTQDVDQLLFGALGITSHAKAGLAIVDHSTICPIQTKQFAKKLSSMHIDFLDGPVSGGDVGAKLGTLSIMVGGNKKTYTRCLPVLEAMGKSITWLGPAGMGQTAKACNQICVSMNLLGVCEAMSLAKKSGLDLDALVKAISGGAAGSWQLSNLASKIANGDLQPGFMIDLILKDLNLVAQAGKQLQLPLQGTKLAQSYFQQACDHGAGKLGTQAMAKTLEKLGGFEF